MSVDYYTCSVCGEAVYEEYIGNCVECGKRICTNCVVNDDVGSKWAGEYGEIYDGSEEQKNKYGITDEWIEREWVKLGEIIDDSAIAEKYCPYCNGNSINEEDLFEFALTKLKLTKEELINEYNRTKGE